jgi:uncharacterized protein
MKRKGTVIGMLAAVLLLLLAGSIAFQGPSATLAQTGETDVTEPTARPRTIEVSGRGRVSVQPDTAVVSFGVTTEAETAVAALEENNVSMTAVISVTEDAGIPAANISTQGLSLQPVYNTTTTTSTTQEIVGYRASNIVQVTVNDLDTLGDLLDEVVAVGGNTIYGIHFEVSGQDELLATAREAAVNDAQQKAAQLVGLFDADLGQVITIIETGGYAPLPVTVSREESLAAGVPIAPGSQIVEATVLVTWAIE